MFFSNHTWKGDWDASIVVSRNPFRSSIRLTVASTS